MSKIPEEIMGKKQSELGVEKPDFEIFEKVQKELDDTVDWLNAKADAADPAGESGKTAPADAVRKAADKIRNAAEPDEVNVEKIMDSRTRKSLSDTMEVKLPQGTVKAADEADVVKETASGDTVPEAFDKVEETIDRAGAEPVEPLDRIKEEPIEALDTINTESVEPLDKIKEEPLEALDTIDTESVEPLDKIKEEPEEALDRMKGAAGSAETDVDDAAADAADAIGDQEEDATADSDGSAETQGKAAAAKAKAEVFSDPRDVLKNKIETTKRRKGWQVLLIEAVIIVLAVVITFTLILGSSTVKGTSMEPNYFEGDRVLYFRMASSFEQNDVIIFHTEENRDLIKRVIAVEGDVVDIEGGAVVVNGTPVESLNVSQDTEESVSGVSDPVEFPLTVEKDHVFVLGDNRSVSIDSRTKKIGQISKDDIAGRVFYMMRGKTK